MRYEDGAAFKEILNEKTSRDKKLRTRINNKIALFKQNHRHNSLNYEKLDDLKLVEDNNKTVRCNFMSFRVSDDWRIMGVEDKGTFYPLDVHPHKKYDKKIKNPTTLKNAAQKVIKDKSNESLLEWYQRQRICAIYDRVIND